MGHFETELLKHDYSAAHDYHRIQIGVFTSVEQLREKMKLAPGALLNRCLYEAIPRHKFTIKQGETALLHWTSEDADGGANRVIFNNLTGQNFGGAEYDVYLAGMREKLDFDIRPDLLILEKTDCRMPDIFDAARIGWLDSVAGLFDEATEFTLRRGAREARLNSADDSQKTAAVVTPGFFWRQGTRHLIFRVEAGDSHYIFKELNDALLFEQGNILPPPSSGYVKAGSKFYLEMQKPLEPTPKPDGKLWRASCFDHWLAARLEESFND